MHRRFRAASYHVYMYTCKYFRSANMPTTFIHRVTRTARVSNDATFTGPDETYAAYRRSRDKSVHRQIRQTDTRIWPICRLEKLVSRPLVRRVLFLSFFIFFFSFFQPSHESRVSSTLRAISANNASALRNGINRGWHVNSDGIRDRSSRSTKEPKSVTWPMTIIVCQITRSISR